MSKALAGIFICLMSVAAFAAKHPDFSGTWEFSPEKSKNIGMMSQMKMTATIDQTATSLDEDAKASMMGGDSDTKTHFDLTGKPTSNEAPMEGPSQTVCKWQGSKLVTTWTSQGAVAGSKTVRKETRSLSPDGKTMIVESVRGSNPAVVMVYDKK